MSNKTFAKQYLLEVLATEINENTQTGEIFVNKSSKIEDYLHTRSVQNLINHLSTHKIRQTLMFYMKLDGLYLPQYTEKIFALDFLNYTIAKNPSVPFELFPKTDHEEIIRFIKNKYLLTVSSQITPRKLFSKNDFREQKRIEQFNGVTGFISKSLNLTPNVFIYKEGVKYLKNVKKINGATVIDCGACDGDSTWLLNRELKPRRIISIEPEIDNYMKLVENIRLNGLRGVTPLNIGVGKHKKVAYMKPGQGGSATVTNTGNKIRIDSIDNISQDLKLQNIRLIKVDIEGYEYDALEGAKNIIRKHKPALIISMYHKGRDLFEIPHLLKKLVPEYRFRFVNLDYQKATLERTLIAEWIK